jgi:two-component system nitrate/nitrite response regulator NarL
MIATNDSKPFAIPLRVAIIDSHELTRRGLERMLINQEGVHLVASWPAADILMVKNSGSAVVVASLEAMIETQRFGKLPCPLVLILHGTEPSEWNRALEFAPAALFVASSVESTSLLASIESASQGKRNETDGFDLRLMTQQANNAHREPLLPLLSPRELQVLTLLIEGDSNKEIARKLGISTNGAKKHVGNVMAKFNCHSRALAVALALKKGIVPIAKPDPLSTICIPDATLNV